MSGIPLHARTNDMYEDLAKAIVIQAVNDYKRSRFLLDTIDLRSYKDESVKYRARMMANREVKNVEAFFRSDWFRALSNLDGEQALVGLDATYKKEYFPVRMEELMNADKKARYHLDESVLG